MTNKVESGQVLIANGEKFTSMTTTMSSGTVQMQFLAGNDVATDTWVDVPDSYWTATTATALAIGQGQRYRFVITGDALVWVAA